MRTSWWYCTKTQGSIKVIGIYPQRNRNVSNTPARRSWVWGIFVANAHWRMLFMVIYRAKMSHVAIFSFHFSYFKKFSWEADVELWWEPGLQTQSITGIKVLRMRSGFSGFSSHKCRRVSRQKAKGRPHTQRSPVCAGTFWGLINSDFLFLLFPLIFLWNGILSPCFPSGDEVLFTKMEGKKHRKRVRGLGRGCF